MSLFFLQGNREGKIQGDYGERGSQGQELAASHETWITMVNSFIFLLACTFYLQSCIKKMEYSKAFASGRI